MKPIRVNSLARKFLTWSGRRFSKSETFSCVHKLMDAKKVMICMPSGMDRFAAAKEALPSLASVFRGKTIQVLLPFLKTDGFLSTPPGYEVIYPHPEELRAFSIPRDNLIQKVKEHHFDVSLDLELDDNLFNRYLCLRCQIPVRIGPHSESAYPFYNVQLTLADSGANGQESYMGMLKTLTNLFPAKR